jgi:acetyl/propionyl-CoA carboxylase alpha subunit
MGSKVGSKELMRRAGVPTLPSITVAEDGRLPGRADVDELGWPLLVKASAGGGGRGMRIVSDPGDLADALSAARREASSAFGDGTVFLERYVTDPRHIEVQVLADRHGDTVALFERECSIQRRHQKVIEEAPSPAVTPGLRARLTEASVAAARAVGYENAGTVEFVVDGDGEPYFLEMNTRLQVEHPVTEMVTGIDLCKEMIRSAAGYPLAFRQEDVPLHGHAMECRIYAEDPDNQFLPTPGRIVGLRVPGGPWVRDESGIYEGMEVPIHYDPMLSKLVVWGSTRDRCITRMTRALGEYSVKGIKTTIPFHARIMKNEKFIKGDLDTQFIDNEFQPLDAARVKPDEDIALVAAAIKAYRRDKERTLRMLGGGPEGGGDGSWWRGAGRIRREGV